MAAPRETIWKLEPHTGAKHEILKRYLQAWMPILSRGGFPEILFIDGFAGPGAYVDGEDGSPIIAIDTALGYQPPLQAKIEFAFVEKDASRATFLESLVKSRDLPRNFHVQIYGGMEFEKAFDQICRPYTERLGCLPPTFAFIDPFGWKGVPFEINRRILEQSNCEVFVNFMYEEINRFLSHPDQRPNFDAYFGGDGWSSCQDLTEPRERNRCIHNYYKNQLLRRAKYVRSFEMRNDTDVTDYFLFYATNNPLGLRKMKEAMWKVNEAGEFTFTDATDPNQLILFEPEPNFAALKAQILDRYSGRTATIGEIKSFVLVETAFRETHFKGQILRPLENEGAVEVLNARPNRKRGTYANDDLQIKFAT